jgi:Ras-related protein Rab-5C
MQSETNEYKVVVLGDSGVGKTSFISRFVKQTFDDYTESTPSASFISKSLVVDGVEVKFNIWDTAGQERFHAIAKVYYRDAAAAILVYDITNAASFEGLKKWVKEVRSTVGTDIAIAVVGNKEDLVEREAVDVVTAKRFAEENQAAYCKASAKTDYGIEEVFTQLVKLVKPLRRETTTSLEERKQQRKHCCG